MNFDILTDKHEEAKRLEREIELLREFKPPKSDFLWCTLNHYGEPRVCGQKDGADKWYMFIIGVNDDEPHAVCDDHGLSAQEYTSSHIPDMIKELDKWLRS